MLALVVRLDDYVYKAIVNATYICGDVFKESEYHLAKSIISS